MKCEHDKEKTRCRECNGPGEGSFCLHGIIRGTCSICSPENSFARYQRQAKARHLSFSLSFSEFEILVKSECIFCGQTPAMGVDRKDSRIGYVSTPNVRNCQSACGLCNRMRSNLDQKFLPQVLKIAKHQESKKAA